MNASAGSICRAALGTPEDHVVLILAHNGPTGASTFLSGLVFGKSG